MQNDYGLTCGQSVSLSLSLSPFFLFSFFFSVFKLSLLTASLWISFQILYMQMKLDGGEWGVCGGGLCLDSLPPLVLLLYVFFFFSLGGAEVGW